MSAPEDRRPQQGIARRSPPSEILREAGYRQRDDAKQLTLTDTENGVEFFYLRPRDIALYVGEGTLDVGITGRDLLLDSGAKADEVLPLGLRPQPVPVRRPGRAATPTSPQLAGTGSPRRTSGWSSAFLEERGIEAERDPARRRGRDQRSSSASPT